MSGPPRPGLSSHTGRRILRPRPARCPSVERPPCPRSPLAVTARLLARPTPLPLSTLPPTPLTLRRDLGLVAGPVPATSTCNRCCQMDIRKLCEFVACRVSGCWRGQGALEGDGAGAGAAAAGSDQLQRHHRCGHHRDRAGRHRRPGHQPLTPAGTTISDVPIKDIQDRHLAALATQAAETASSAQNVRPARYLRTNIEKVLDIRPNLGSNR
jgi:hypothetical protein